MSPIRWLLANALPLAVGGKPNGVVTTFADITAQVEAQNQLRASEEKYRGLVEMLPVMLLRADRELRLTYANPSARDVSGYDLTEAAGPEAWGRVLHPEDLVRVRALAREALEGQPARTEIRYQARDGSDRVAYALLQPCRQDGAVTGLLALLVDVTRQRRLEQELQRAQRLELIGRLSSGIAHDFNNLLNLIGNLTSLAQRHLPPGHEARADLHHIDDAVQQASGLARQLLDLCKQRPVRPRRIEINEVARRTLELLQATLPETIGLDAALDDRPLAVRADETQLQQVLMNLCLNARDAMPEGGRLRVETALEERPTSSVQRPTTNETEVETNAEEEFGVQCSLPEQGGWVRLSVRDEGQGMSEQVQAQIFAPFFTTKERGTGLGLAVVQQIVESYGGHIIVSSHPGRGARFDVWLPESDQ